MLSLGFFLGSFSRPFSDGGATLLFVGRLYFLFSSVAIIAPAKFISGPLGTGFRCYLKYFDD